MTFIRAFIALCWFSMVCASQSLAQAPVEVLPQASTQRLGPFLQFLLLEDGAFPQPQDIPNLKPSQSNYPNFGTHQGHFWFFVRLQNSTDQPIERLFVSAFHNTNCQSYLMPLGQLPGAQTPALPVWEPPFWLSRHWITLPASQGLDLWVSCQTKVHMGLIAELYTQPAFWKSEIFRNSSNMTYYGGLAALFLYNLFLALSLRERGYWLYLGCLLSFGGLQTGVDGTLLTYLNGNTVPAVHITHIFLGGVGLFFPLFTQELLQTHLRIPRWNRLLTAMTYAGGAYVIFAVVVPYSWLAYGTFLVGGVLPLILITAGILCMIQGSQTAKFYVAAWTFYMSGILFYTLCYWGWDVWGIGLFNYAQVGKIGSLLEITLLALALANRINRLRKEREKSQNQILHLLTESAKDLERKVAERTLELQQSHHEIVEKNQLLQESLTYSKRIQSALLPNLHEFYQHFPEGLILWRPKDQVGGDIYFFHARGDQCILTLLDCTGHGVPGALLSMLAQSALRRILIEEGYFNPAQILHRLHELLQLELNPQQQSNQLDGLDAGVCLVDPVKDRVLFAGARMDLWWVEQGQTQRLKGQKVSLGYGQGDLPPLLNQEVALRGKKFYLASDGIKEQPHGPKGFPMGNRRFGELIAHLSSLAPEVAKAQLLETLSQEQPILDDITLIRFHYPH